MLIRKLLSNILISIWLIGFNPIVSCYVRGYVYLEEGMLSFKRDDLCLLIKNSILENKMELYDRDFWVLIEIPKDTKGFVTFWYRWGSGNAYVGTKSIPVKWGRVKEG